MSACGEDSVLTYSALSSLLILEPQDADQTKILQPNPDFCGWTRKSFVTG